MSGPANPAILGPDVEPVLIVMVNKNLGNLCVSLPVIDRLARHFDARPDVVVDERYADLARTSLPSARVLGSPVSVVAGATLVTRLVARGYRAAIDVSGGVRSTTLVGASRSPHRVGLDSSRRSWMYNQRITDAAPAHALDRYAQVLQCIGERGRPPLIRHRSRPDDRDAVRAALRDELAADAGPLVVLHCGAGKPYRLWPAERFAAVADGLVERCGAARFCLIGTPDERPLMQRVRAAMRAGDRAGLLHLPIAQLPALFDEADLMMCNESGPMHVAALTGVPIVAIFGPTAESRWAPIRGERTVTLRGADCDPRCGRRGRCAVDFRCLEGLTVDRVLDDAAQLIGARTMVESA
ncbi:MAG: glycosyltransferase family 9 protein [Planctomycetota bacterium]